ncbi:hypothetical protein CYMTET_33553 [Cymbomonas tetramitiformis]|uniref:Uncharacterized protein n=1 Tax=Cymbomonas tetramitiformis TaxID=36881 RepID=A0AAE0KQU7_9CHLO|nr:hypothetical protein CYMTET_33553 [Cymbomonas tetramitiformis]
MDLDLGLQSVAQQPRHDFPEQGFKSRGIIASSRVALKNVGQDAEEQLWQKSRRMKTFSSALKSTTPVAWLVS